MCEVIRRKTGSGRVIPSIINLWPLRLVGFKALLLQGRDHPFESDRGYLEIGIYPYLKYTGRLNNLLIPVSKRILRL